MKQKVLKVDPKDNVIVALQNLSKWENLEYQGGTFVLADDIPAKHKFFIDDMTEGDKVIMYGVLVGKAQTSIPRGGLMTTANVKHAAEPFHFRPYNYQWQPPDVSRFIGRTFKGYHRSDGRVGTANHWLFVPTVFCENRNLDVIREALHTQLGYEVSDKYKQKTQLLLELYKKGTDVSSADLSLKESVVSTGRIFKNVDGIKFLNHQGGCGGTRQDAAVLSRLLAAYADHPNVSGVTILSLGCQNLQTENLLDDIRKHNPGFDKPLYVFEQQQSQSEEQLITEAIRKTFIGLIEINKLERKPASLDKLTIGVKCGGSDGFSGISANPAVGYCSDLVVALGGKILLAEFPELCGAEQDLIDRTV
ncbi:MAG: UxaA family hydrolase, partial [Chitinophagaceae bacterium]|nr:UxaA family hydrolase [Chitinophagaceae bacterium]